MSSTVVCSGSRISIGKHTRQETDLPAGRYRVGFPTPTRLCFHRGLLSLPPLCRHLRSVVADTLELNDVDDEAAVPLAIDVGPRLLELVKSISSLYASVLLTHPLEPLLVVAHAANIATTALIAGEHCCRHVNVSLTWRIVAVSSVATSHCLDVVANRRDVFVLQ